MLKPTIAKPALLAPILALFSCAAPKAIVVGPPNARSQGQVAQTGTEKPSKPSRPALREDRIRLPDMMTLPGDDEFRTTKRNTPATDGTGGAVISRPPTEPPTRPKP